MSESKVHGKILEKNKLVMMKFVGDAEDDGVKYQLLNSMSRSPIVESEKTGKKYVLDRNDILDMAVEAGIDEPFEEDAKK